MLGPEQGCPMTLSIAWGGMGGGQPWPCPTAPAEGKRLLLRHLADPAPIRGQLYKRNMPANYEVAHIVWYQSHLLANSEKEPGNMDLLSFCGRRKGDRSI